MQSVQRRCFFFLKLNQRPWLKLCVYNRHTPRTTLKNDELIVELHKSSSSLRSRILQCSVARYLLFHGHEVKIWVFCVWDFFFFVAFSLLLGGNFPSTRHRGGHSTHSQRPTIDSGVVRFDENLNCENWTLETRRNSTTPWSWYFDIAKVSCY